MDLAQVTAPCYAPRRGDRGGRWVFQSGQAGGDLLSFLSCHQIWTGILQELRG